MSETVLSKISEHVYWMSPGKPDRPSLCLVVGTDYSLMIDAGASDAHTRLFLDAITEAGLPYPRYVVLTHWHWDHVFGAASLSIPVIAHTGTAEQLAILATYDWTDAAIDQRVLTGEEIASCARDIKLELPEPRTVRIAQPDISFDKFLEFNLGGITCEIHHVGGDHSPDSCIAYVRLDKVLVLGDCLYHAIHTPVESYTKEALFPLLKTVLGSEADQCIEGHNAKIMTRDDIETMADQISVASALADEFGPDLDAALAKMGELDEDTMFFVRAFMNGVRLQKEFLDSLRYLRKPAH